MYEDVNVENEKLVDDFFNSDKSKGMIIEINQEEDYIIIEDIDTKELIKADVGLGFSKAISVYDLPLYTCYDKKTKRTVNP